VRATFGDSLLATEERVSRVVEEAVELAQAEGVPAERLHALVRHVYAKPPGDPAQEVGGVGVTVLAYCAAVGISADDAEAREVERVLALPVDHFRRRQAGAAGGGATRWSGGTP
jgi:hypothetical protein